MIAQTSTAVTSRRKLSGEHALYSNGVVVGCVMRLAAKRNFGLFLTDVYWRNDEPNRTSGSIGTSAKTLKAAIELAAKTLAELK